MGRRIIWVGSSLDDLSAFPADVKRAFGFQLRQVQDGATPLGARPLAGIGRGVYELRQDHDTDTFRTVYLVRTVRGVYVLHAFKKKSKSGRAIPREVLETVKARLGRALALDAEDGDGR